MMRIAVSEGYDCGRWLDGDVEAWPLYGSLGDGLRLAFANDTHVYRDPFRVLNDHTCEPCQMPLLSTISQFECHAFWFDDTSSIP